MRFSFRIRFLIEYMAAISLCAVLVVKTIYSRFISPALLRTASKRLTKNTDTHKILEKIRM